MCEPEPRKLLQSVNQPDVVFKIIPYERENQRVENKLMPDEVMEKAAKKMILDGVDFLLERYKTYLPTVRVVIAIDNPFFAKKMVRLLLARRKGITIIENIFAGSMR